MLLVRVQLGKPIHKLVEPFDRLSFLNLLFVIENRHSVIYSFGVLDKLEYLMVSQNFNLTINSGGDKIII